MSTTYHILSPEPQLYTEAKAWEVAADLARGEDMGWSYKPTLYIEADEGAGTPALYVIAVYDETGWFVGNF